MTKETWVIRENITLKEINDNDGILLVSLSLAPELNYEILPCK